MLVLHGHYNCAYFHFCEWVERHCAALYAGLLMNVSLIFSILDRKNLAKSSASSSSVFLGSKGFCVVLPVSLLTRWRVLWCPSCSPRLSYLPIVFWSSGVDTCIYFFPLYMLSNGAAPYISFSFSLCFWIFFTVHVRWYWTIGFVAFLASWLFFWCTFLKHFLQLKVKLIVSFTGDRVLI